MESEKHSQQNKIEFLPNSGLNEPSYLLDFLRSNLDDVIASFESTPNNSGEVNFLNLLDNFSQKLPLGDSFKELTAVLILGENESIHLLSVEGEYSFIEGKSIAALLYVLGNNRNISALKALIIHTHPFYETFSRQEVQSIFSEQDKIAFKNFGQMLSILFPTIQGLKVGVCTAGPSKSKVVKAKKNYSWNIWELNF